MGIVDGGPIKLASLGFKDCVSGLSTFQEALLMCKVLSDIATAYDTLKILKLCVLQVEP